MQVRVVELSREGARGIAINRLNGMLNMWNDRQEMGWPGPFLITFLDAVPEQPFSSLWVKPRALLDSDLGAGSWTLSPTSSFSTTKVLPPEFLAWAGLQASGSPWVAPSL